MKKILCSAATPLLIFCFWFSSLAQTPQKPETLYIPWGTKAVPDGEFTPDGVDPLNLGRVIQQQSSCLAQGYTNSCAGPGLRFLWTGGGTLARWEITRLADNRTFVVPGNAISYLDKVGCNWSSSYIYTAITSTGQRCSVMTSGSPPHSSCENSQGTTLCQSEVQAPTQNAASFSDIVAGGSIVAAYTPNLGFASASSLPLPTTLNGVKVLVEGREAGIFSLAGNQVNFFVPTDLPDVGYYGVEVQRPDGSAAWGRLYRIVNNPSLFAASSNGQGIAAGYWINNSTGTSGSLTTPVDRRNGQGYVVLYATGMNGFDGATVTIAGRTATPVFAGAAPGFIGLQQINGKAPDDLGPGEYSVYVCGGGRCSNQLLIRL